MLTPVSRSTGYHETDRRFLATMLVSNSKDSAESVFMHQQFSVELLQQCIFLAGPTAVGKTDATLELASRILAGLHVHLPRHGHRNRKAI